MMSNTLRLLVCLSLCFVFQSTGAQGTDWMFATNENGTETATAVVRDHAHGCFYVTGYFEGTITEAVGLVSGVSVSYPMSYTSNGGTDIFIARIADDGELEWFKTFGSDEDDRALIVEVGANGLLYVGGFLKGTATISSSSGPSMPIGHNVANEPRNPFIVAFNPNGDPVWKMSHGTAGHAVVADIKADEDGLNVLTYHESQNFVSPNFSLDNGHQFLLHNLNYSHELMWKSSFGSPGSLTNFDWIDTHRPRLALFDHNLYVVGVNSTTGFNISGNTFSVSTDDWSAISSDQIFMASFTTNGGFNWVHPIETSSGSYAGFGLAVGCDGLYLGGALRFQGGLQFPGMLVTGSAKQDLFVAKFLPTTGQTVWVNVYDSPQGNDDDIALSLELDDHGGVIVGGLFKQSIAIPGFPDLSGDNMEGLVFGLDTDGIANWVLPLSGEDDDAVLHVDLIEAGELVVCGRSGKTFNGFIDAQITDEANAFVARIKYPSTGPANCCLALDGGTITTDNLSLCVGQPFVIYHDLLAENRKLQHSLLGFAWSDVQPVTSNPIVITDPLLGFYRVQTDYGDCGVVNSNLLSPNFLAAVSINCPADKTVSLASSCEFIVPDYSGELIVAGACPMDIVQSPAPGTSLAAGLYTISIQGMIAGLPVSSCSFDLNVQDAASPTLICLPDITRITANGCPYALEDLTGLVTASDNCGSVSISQSLSQGTMLNVGDHNITFSAVDDAGNSISCTSTLHIVTGATSFGCPIDQGRIADPTNCGYILEDFKTMLVLTGYCSGTTIVQTPAAGTFLTVGNHTINFQLTDSFGAVSNCSMDLVIVDNTPPVLTGIGLQTLPIVSGCSRAMPNFTSLIGVNESCGYVLTQSPTPGVQKVPGSYNVVITCIDNSGNASNTSFTLEVVDQIDPILSYPSMVTLQADASCTLTVEDLTGYVNVTENCSAISWSQFPFPGSVVGIGDSPVEIEVTDAAGNITMASFILRVLPNPSWTVTCQPNVVLNGVSGTCSASANLADPTVSGLCVGYSVSNDAPSLFPVGDTIVTWTITSDDGDEQTCLQTVTVNDVQPPTISCPGELILFVISGCSRAIPNYTGMASASDWCGAVSITQSPAAGTILPIGEHIITLTSTDASGNSASCQFTLIVKDTNSPNITCLSNQVRNANSSCQYTVENFTSLVSVVDDCGASVIIQNPTAGSILPAGTHVIQIFAIDISGNTSQCSFSLNVLDTVAPVVTCQPDIELPADSGECFATYTPVAPVAADVCGIASVVNDGPTVFPLGTTMVTWTVTDFGGNVTTCSNIVHVQDVEGPVFACPISHEVTAPECSYTLSDYAIGLALSDCQSASIVQTPQAGEVLTIGDHTVVLTATDEDGNETMCSFVVTVVENVFPQITCLEDQLRTASNTCGYAIEDFTSIAVTSDNCGVFSITQTPVAGEVLAVGMHAVTLAVVDNNGNESTCTFNLEVVDNVAPAIDCTSELTLVLDAGSCFATTTLSDPIVTDACGIFSISNDAPSQFNLGITFVNWTIVDQNGNVSSCTQTIHVVDDQLPVLACLPDAERSLGAECQYLLEDFTLIASATDNCGNIVFTQSPSPGIALPQGQHIIEIEAADQAGNHTVCSFTLNVVDDLAPILTCLSDEVRELNNNCTYLLENFESIIEFSDNCGVQMFSQSPVAGTELVFGEHLISIQVVDMHGNVSLCEFNLTIVDSTPPGIDCQEDVTIIANAGSCVSSYIPLTPVVIESCETFTITNDAPAEFPIGNTDVHWVVTDLAGNENSCSQTITVVDLELPVIMCLSDQDRTLGTDCTYVLEDFTPLISVSENCGEFSLSQTPSFGSQLSEGDHVIEILATDQSGNTSTCSFFVHVTDVSAPGLECPTNLVQSSEACLAAIPDFSAEVVVSECSQYTYEQQPSVGTLIAPGVYPITVTVVDEFGQSNTCLTQFEFQTTTTLEVVCNLPSEVSVSSCSFEIPDYSVGAEILSSCGEVVFTQVPAPGTIVSDSAVEVILQAADANGNTYVCSQQIAFGYFTDISLILQADTVLFVESNCEANMNFETPVAVGGCGEVELVQTFGPLVGESVAAGDYEIEFTATDEWGNIGIGTFVVSVVDGQLPTIACGANVSSCDPFVMPASPVAEDNCEIASVELSTSNIWHPGLAFADGITEVIYIATDVYGNAATCTTLVQINLPEIPEWSMSTSWCVGDEPLDLDDLLLASEGYTWTGAIDGNHIMDPSSIGQGEHTITLTSTEGMCSIDSTITFTIGVRPVVSAGVDFEVCGLNTEVTGFSSGDNTLWTCGPTALVLNANNLTAILEADEYQEELFVLTGYGDFGCSSSDSVYVTFVEPASAPSFSEDQITILLGEELNTQFTFDGIGDLNVSWVDGVSAPIDLLGNNIVVNGLEEGVYEMALSSTNLPCQTESDHLIIEVLALSIPNGISPNGDGLNDVFEITGLELYPYTKVQVFDRDGNLVYQSQNYDNTWDGVSLRGDALPADTYFMIVELADGTTVESYLIIRRS